MTLNLINWSVIFASSTLIVYSFLGIDLLQVDQLEKARGSTC